MQHAQPDKYSQPTKTENGSSLNREAVAVASSEPDNVKANEKKRGEQSFQLTDWLLVLFNGLLALYTWRLYLATRGLVEAAHHQTEDIKASTKAATNAAKAAVASNQIAVYNAEQQSSGLWFLHDNAELDRRANPPEGDAGDPDDRRRVGRLDARALGRSESTPATAAR